MLYYNLSINLAFVVFTHFCWGLFLVLELLQVFTSTTPVPSLTLDTASYKGATLHWNCRFGLQIFYTNWFPLLQCFSRFGEVVFTLTRFFRDVGTQCPTKVSLLEAKKEGQCLLVLHYVGCVMSFLSIVVSLLLYIYFKSFFYWYDLTRPLLIQEI